MTTPAMAKILDTDFTDYHECKTILDTDFTDLHRLQNNTLPFQRITAEIDQQPQTQFGSRQIIQHLFDMSIGQLLNRFALKQDFFSNNKISAIKMRKDDAFVVDFIFCLARKWNARAA